MANVYGTILEEYSFLVNGEMKSKALTLLWNLVKKSQKNELYNFKGSHILRIGFLKNDHQTRSYDNAKNIMSSSLHVTECLLFCCFTNKEDLMKVAHNGVPLIKCANGINGFVFDMHPDILIEETYKNCNTCWMVLFKCCIGNVGHLWSKSLVDIPLYTDNQSYRDLPTKMIIKEKFGSKISAGQLCQCCPLGYIQFSQREDTAMFNIPLIYHSTLPKSVDQMVEAEFGENIHGYLQDCQRWNFEFVIMCALIKEILKNLKMHYSQLLGKIAFLDCVDKLYQTNHANMQTVMQQSITPECESTQSYIVVEPMVKLERISDENEEFSEILGHDLTNSSNSLEPDFLVNQHESILTKNMPETVACLNNENVPSKNIENRTCLERPPTKKHFSDSTLLSCHDLELTDISSPEEQISEGTLNLMIHKICHEAVIEYSLQDNQSDKIQITNNDVTLQDQLDVCRTDENVCNAKEESLANALVVGEQIDDSIEHGRCDPCANFPEDYSETTNSFITVHQSEELKKILESCIANGACNESGSVLDCATDGDSGLNSMECHPEESATSTVTINEEMLEKDEININGDEAMEFSDENYQDEDSLSPGRLVIDFNRDLEQTDLLPTTDPFPKTDQFPTSGLHVTTEIHENRTHQENEENAPNSLLRLNETEAVEEEVEEVVKTMEEVVKTMEEVVKTTEEVVETMEEIVGIIESKNTSVDLYNVQLDDIQIASNTPIKNNINIKNERYDPDSVLKKSMTAFSRNLDTLLKKSDHIHIESEPHSPFVYTSLQNNKILCRNYDALILTNNPLPLISPQNIKSEITYKQKKPRSNENINKFWGNSQLKTNETEFITPIQPKEDTMKFYSELSQLSDSVIKKSLKKNKPVKKTTKRKAEPSLETDNIKIVRIDLTQSPSCNPATHTESTLKCNKEITDETKADDLNVSVSTPGYDKCYAFKQIKRMMIKKFDHVGISELAKLLNLKHRSAIKTSHKEEILSMLSTIRKHYKDLELTNPFLANLKFQGYDDKIVINYGMLKLSEMRLIDALTKMDSHLYEKSVLRFLPKDLRLPEEEDKFESVEGVCLILKYDAELNTVLIDFLIALKNKIYVLNDHIKKKKIVKTRDKYLIILDDLHHIRYEVLYKLCCIDKCSVNIIKDEISCRLSWNMNLAEKLFNSQLNENVDFLKDIQLQTKELIKCGAYLKDKIFL